VVWLGGTLVMDRSEIVLRRLPVQLRTVAERLRSAVALLQEGVKEARAIDSDLAVLTGRCPGLGDAVREIGFALDRVSARAESEATYHGVTIDSLLAVWAKSVATLREHTRKLDSQLVATITE